VGAVLVVKGANFFAGGTWQQMLDDEPVIRQWAATPTAR